MDRSRPCGSRARSDICTLRLLHSAVGSRRQALDSYAGPHLHGGLPCSPASSPYYQLDAGPHSVTIVEEMKEVITCSDPELPQVLATDCCFLVVNKHHHHLLLPLPHAPPPPPSSSSLILFTLACTHALAAAALCLCVGMRSTYTMRRTRLA